jgi:membrane-associated protease RseP (regulator of RpoE activity)
MADIFLSYATEDRARAKLLAETLEQRGWTVWWDRKIPLGQAFDNVIEGAIAAAGCVVVLWSHASVVSEWVRSEASEGKRRGILVPVSIDAAVAPLAFRLLNGADLSAWQPGTPHPELDRLTERIAEILGQAGTIDPPLVPPASPQQFHSPPRPPRPPWFRNPRVIGGLAILMLIVVGGVYAGFVMRRQRPPTDPTNILPVDFGRVVNMLSPGRKGFESKDLKMHLTLVTPEEAGMGMSAGGMVFRVDTGPAQAAGVHAMDVITSINGRKIATEDDLRAVFNALGPGKSKYTISRGSETLTLEIDCPTCEIR